MPNPKIPVVQGPERLVRLRVGQFRNVAPGTEIEFDDSRSIMLGINGAGKTTLLELVALVLSGDFTGVKENIDLEYEVDSSRSKYTIRLKTTIDWVSPPSFQHQRRAEPLLRKSTSWSVTCNAYKKESLPTTTIASDGSRLTVEVGEADAIELHASDYGYIHPDQSTYFPHPMLFHLVAEDPKISHWKDILKQCGAIPGEFRHPGRFQEGLEYLDRLEEKAQVTFFDPPGFQGVSPNLISLELSFIALSEFKNRISRSDSWPSQLECKATDTFLENTLRSAVDFGGIEFSLKLVRGVSSTGSAQQAPCYGDLRFFVTTPSGRKIPCSDLSYGERRFLSLVHYAVACGTYFVADEPTNGLHHRLIDQLTRVMEMKQSFIAIQNPLLLDHMSFDSAESLRSCLVLCERVTSDDKQNTLLSWRQMSNNEAAEVFAACQVGIQSLSEVLHLKGLW